MRRIAVPISKDKICTYFGQASSFLIFNTEADTVISIDFEEVPPTEPLKWPGWLAQMQVTDVIVRNMGMVGEDVLLHNGINVVRGDLGSRPSEAIYSFIKKRQPQVDPFYAGCRAEIF